LNHYIKVDNMRNLLDTSVTSDKIKSRVLVYGTCAAEEHQGVMDEFRDYSSFRVCMTTSDLEKIAWKLATIVRVKDTKEVAALTMDGSPHCLQLHFALADLKKMFPQLKTKHYVVEKGELLRISERAVRTARHLHEIEDLCNATD
jgi:hypothetical protein